jgi:hypothetical protein
VRNCKLLLGLVSGLVISASSSNAIVLNFDALTGTEIDFPGNSAFSFTSTNGYQFAITSVTGGVGDSVGLDGYITPGGPFTIGSISNPQPGEEMASVSGTGMLHITDSSSQDFTAQIQWDTITTFGTAGILDLSGTVNLTDFQYSGSNKDLWALVAGGMGSDVITFQFTPAESLTQLATTPNETSYSGSIAVPEPPSSVLILGGLAALYCIFRLRRAVG